MAKKSLLIKMRLIFLFLLGATILFSACEKDINLDLEGSPPRLVVNAWVTNVAANVPANPSSTKITNKTGYVVKLTTTASYYASDSAPAVSGATVIISGSDNPSKRDTLKETHPGSGMYMGDSTNFGKSGVTYSLFIQHNGQVYTAQDKLDSIPPIDTALVSANTSGKKGYHLTYVAHNIAGSHYYLFRYYKNDSLLNGPTNIFVEPPLGTVINPNTPELPLGSPFLYQATDVTYVELFSLSETNYMYYYDLLQQLSATGPLGGLVVIFGNVPANVQGNVSNGALGFFQASMYWTYSLTIPK